MVTKEEWQEYQEYRSVVKRKQLSYIDDNLPKPITKKKRFLFWEWENTDWAFSISGGYLHSVTKMAEYFHPIPPETIEGCLNWLIEKEKQYQTDAERAAYKRGKGAR